MFGHGDVRARRNDASIRVYRTSNLRYRIGSGHWVKYFVPVKGRPQLIRPYVVTVRR